MRDMTSSSGPGIMYEPGVYDDTLHVWRGNCFLGGKSSDPGLRRCVRKY